MTTAKKMYREEPPEGGWGYLIGLGMALPFISALGCMPSFGLVFGDFLHNLGEKTSAIAVVTSLFFSSMSFAGLLTNTLFRRYSIRTVGLIGGSLYFFGSLLQIFVQSTWHLIIAFSLIQGAAFGLMIPVAYTSFNAYFVKRRVLMMNIAQTLIGIGTMVYPMAMRFLLDSFGFRGCLAILAAFNGHAIFGMMVMHPVDWHIKRIEIDECELKEIIKKNQLENQNNLIIKNDLEAANEEKSHLEPLMGDENSKNNINENGLNNHELKRDSKSNSMAKLSNNNLEKVVENSIDNKKSMGIWEYIVDFLDLTLMKDPIYVNIVLGISFALYSDIAFFTLQPLYLFELGFSKASTAEIIAIGAAADLGSRIFLAGVSAFITIPSRYVYLSGSLFTVISRFAFLLVFDYTGMAVITAIMGFLRTWIHVTLPLVFGEYLPKERFPSGYGLFMFLQGNITFLIGPFVGYIRDVTHSYPITFHCLNFFMAACAVPWLIEIAIIKLKKKATTV
ncbi:monocarboxylate transporter 7 [Condylostylus longicornis]|uniref:monocarboxylate transporter 7 n=1 Tax=Condylostylus longicornis TaxID=2530218 RepID=UPI00244E032E|nr:monocarboxylate transporter 7 [Condylostylus longicornis]